MLDRCLQDVEPDTTAVQGRLLADESHVASERVDIHVLEIDSVERDSTAQGVVEPLNETDRRGFTALSCTPSGQRLVLDNVCETCMYLPQKRHTERPTSRQGFQDRDLATHERRVEWGTGSGRSRKSCFRPPALG